MITHEIRELIVNNATATRIKEAARKEGMTSLLENGLEKILEGVTSLHEVLSTVSDM